MKLRPSVAQLGRQADAILYNDGAFTTGYVKTRRVPTNPTIKNALKLQRKEAFCRANDIFRALPKDQRRDITRQYKEDCAAGLVRGLSWGQWLVKELDNRNGLSLQRTPTGDRPIH